MSGRPPVVPDYDLIWQHVYGDMQRNGPVHRHSTRILGRILRGLAYDSAIDVGCGTGHNLALLQSGRRLARVAGTDVSAWALERAREAVPEAELFEADIQQAPIPGRWDLVYSSWLLEHLPDDEATLRHMRQMTSKYALIATIAGDFERYRAWDERIGHVRNYRVGELERKLTDAGFRVRSSMYWGFPFYSPLARTIQNYGSAGTGEFGLVTRLAAEAFYYLYFLNSYRRGDILIALAEV